MRSEGEVSGELGEAAMGEPLLQATGDVWESEMGDLWCRSSWETLWNPRGEPAPWWWRPSGDPAPGKPWGEDPAWRRRGEVPLWGREERKVVREVVVGDGVRVSREGGEVEEVDPT